MEETGTRRPPTTPWEFPEILSEEGLRQAREYFFQTHGKNSQMIAEGRSATGFANSLVRRRLSKELGDDYKMYTGEDVGSSKGDAEESKGIRGELNALLRSIYEKVAPQTPVTSPIQEDLAILSHPVGALEVCFGMISFYNDLLKKYASFAANRRQVLKSVIDEELFKWIWRLYYAFALSDRSKTPTFRENIPSSGLNFIPLEKQRLPTSDKVYEIGIFLLGSGLAGSHLRFSIAYYFVCYLRLVQFRLLPAIDRALLDGIFEAARSRKEDSPTEEILVAIDALMNAKGTSMESFDDILKDEETVAQQTLPEPENLFLSQVQDFSNHNLPESLKKFLPQAQK
ncbi:MAG: hypothetical protein V3S29_12900, partial [bacterium]